VYLMLNVSGILQTQFYISSHALVVCLKWTSQTKGLQPTATENYLSRLSLDGFVLVGTME